MKKLDSFGMKYTNWLIRFFIVCVATFAAAAQTQAQSSYASSAPNYSASSLTAASENADEPQGAMITLHSRVNECRVR